MIRYHHNHRATTSLADLWAPCAGYFHTTMSSNSWVLITGANRTTGLGYITARKLVNDGESVIIGARTQASGELSVLPRSVHVLSPSSTRLCGGCCTSV